MRKADLLPELPMPSFCSVYPESVAEGAMSGQIFLPDNDERSALVWHFCGFGFILGEPDAEFLEEILRLMLTGERRLVLFSDSMAVEEFLRSRKEIQAGKRLFFRYEGELPEADPSLLPINRELLQTMDGKVVPRIFWESPDEFLKNGMGFCEVREGKPAAWAFSAAVSRKELDIGVETAPGFQRQGLALKTAGAMIRFAMETGRDPVWACAETNAGSRKTAEKLGFIQSGSCLTFQKRSN